MTAHLQIYEHVDLEGMPEPDRQSPERAYGRLSPAQCRKARDIAGWDVGMLRAMARVPDATIIAFEAGERTPTEDAVVAIYATFRRFRSIIFGRNDYVARSPFATIEDAVLCGSLMDRRSHHEPDPDLATGTDAAMSSYLSEAEALEPERLVPEGDGLSIDELRARAQASVRRASTP